MCGADQDLTNDALRKAGSPPRVRSRLAGHVLEHETAGITSACAEQTTWLDLPFDLPLDHLRVCGADVETYIW